MPEDLTKNEDVAEDVAEDKAEAKTEGKSETPLATQAAMLEGLQDENNRLKNRIDELLGAQQDSRLEGQRVKDAEQANEQLRRRYADVALRSAIVEAAASLGINSQAAGIYSHRFQCEIDADGKARITPNPTEFLLKELKDSPLLQQSVAVGRQQQQASAVVHGAAAIGEADPVELMTALDRDAGKKAGFIRRHGTQAFVDLAGKARRKGYRS